MPVVEDTSKGGQAAPENTTGGRMARGRQLARQMDRAQAVNTAAKGEPPKMRTSVSSGNIGFSGTVADPFNNPEPIHMGLARGALRKAAKGYKEGEVTPDEFDKHIAQAHSRLKPSMSQAMVILPTHHTRITRKKPHAVSKV